MNFENRSDAVMTTTEALNFYWATRYLESLADYAQVNAAECYKNIQ